MNELNAKTFKEWMLNHYEVEDLQAIHKQGCSSGCAHGLIYYSETLAIYDNFCDELHDVLASDIENFGEVPKYIADALAIGCTSFKNALVWYVAETYAFDITNEIEEA
jgi:hypothetical protein